MKQSEAVTKLRALGLTRPVDVVREAVQRLRNGESVYRLHHEDPPLVAKATAKKIRDLLNEGKLSFLFEIQPGLEAAELAGEMIVTDSLPVRVSLSGDSSAQSVRDRVNNILSVLPWFDWNIEHLESIGIPLNEAFRLKLEHDSLFVQLEDLGAADLQRLLETSRIGLLCQRESAREHGAPYEYILLAAAAWAKGQIDNNPFLIITARNILGYQVWREQPEFLEAFKSAQIATHRVTRHLKQKYEEVLTNWSQLTPRERLIGVFRGVSLPLDPHPETRS